AEPPAPAMDLTPTDRSRQIPLSAAQERLWLLDRTSAAYNMPVAFHVRGDLSIRALRESFGALVARHEILRTTYAPLPDGSAHAVVHAHAEPDFAVVDATTLSAAEASTLVSAEAARPFDLTRGFLVRVRVFTRPRGEHVVSMVLHHIISDGWSLGLIASEWSGLYNDALEGRRVETTGPALQFADFAAAQRRWLAGDAIERQLAFWRTQLD